MVTRSEHYFGALMKNSTVRKLNDLIIFFLCCGFGYVQEIDALLIKGNVDSFKLIIRLILEHGLDLEYEWRRNPDMLKPSKDY